MNEYLMSSQHNKYISYWVSDKGKFMNTVDIDKCSNPILLDITFPGFHFKVSCLSVDSSWMREMFYLTTHSTHFIYSYMVPDIW